MLSGSESFGRRAPLSAIAGLSVLIMTGSHVYAQESSFPSGWFIGAEGALVTPYFEQDVLGYDASFGPNNTLQVLSFDWDAEGAYRGWVGYERASGFGVSLSHSILNQSTDFSLAEAPGSRLEVDFDPDSDDVRINVDGTLVARNTLDMDVTDVEFWQRADLGTLKLRFGAGLRYAMYDRSYFAFETGGNQFIRFDHTFNGIGPSLAYEAEIPVRGGVSLYNSGRVAFLFGEHKSNYQGAIATEDAGALSNDALVTTLDTEVGLQWRGRVGEAGGEWTFRAGVDAQAWFNGGGWDFLHGDMGAIFPQQAGTFGLLGFNASAQYKFGAGPDGAAGRPANLPAIVAQGFFIGAEGSLVTPYFERDILGGDEDVGGAPGPLEVLSFDWDADGAYRGWVGYERASGLGVSLSHSILNQSTNFSRAEGTGDLRVYFHPDEDPADITVDGTLVAKNTLEMDVTDVEFWQRADLGGMKFRAGAGLRYAMYDRSYFAFETGGPEFVRFDHTFDGIGPSLNYEVEIPVAGRVSLYNSGRAAFLFGEHKSNYQGERAVDNTGASSNYAMVPTLDAEVGLQWRGRVGEAGGELTLRAGVDAQAWFNGGGWDLYDDDGGATFPQQAGTFGLLAFNASAQYKFGAGEAGAAGQCGDKTLSCAGRSHAALPAIVAQGWFIGVEGALATPYFERDILGADEDVGGTPGPLQVLSFDWDADGAYRGWVGYERASGFGVSLSHAVLNQSTSFSRAEGAGDLQVHFDPDSDDASIDVDGTLVARNTLDMDVTDVEFWQRADLGKVKLRFGAGLRYAMYDRSYFAFETGGNEFIRFDHSFDGIGPSLNYEVEVPVRGRVSLYNSGRAAFLFGEHKSNYQGERATGDAGALSNDALVTTLDGQLGLQWQGQVSESGRELTLRAGVTGQTWFNGGGWDLYADDGGALFPQHAGSFSILGFVASAQLKF